MFVILHYFHFNVALMRSNVIITNIYLKVFSQIINFFLKKLKIFQIWFYFKFYVFFFIFHCVFFYVLHNVINFVKNVVVVYCYKWMHLLNNNIEQIFILQFFYLFIIICGIKNIFFIFVTIIHKKKYLLYLFLI